MNKFRESKLAKPEKSELEQALETLAEEYRELFGNYATMGEFIIDREGFEELLAWRKENIILNSKYIGRGNIDIWKLANKAGKFERFSYPDSEQGDYIHATNW